MPPLHIRVIAIALGMISIGWHRSAVQAQNAPVKEPAAGAVNSQEAARRKILESDRWRQTLRDLNEWLSVQHIYTPDEVANLRAEFTARIARMSPRELEALMKDMEERLDVLMSPAAEEARQWLGQFLAVAVNPEAQLGRTRPDVLNMTASQIRQELQWLEQHRAGRQQAHTAFGGARAGQVQSARDVHTSRQQALEQELSRPAATVNNPRYRSQYAPQTELRPTPLNTPIYSISPWGHPIHWHPMHGQW